MSKLPAEYKWIDDVPNKPRMISEALALYGTHEAAGGKDNPVIIAWAHEIGGDIKASYLHDETPWCGLFMAVVAIRSSKTPPVNPLWAKNWRKFGTAADKPSFGDTLVFTREGGGHVGLYLAEDEGGPNRPASYHVLGGNQSDTVNVRTMPKSRIYAVRRPIWSVAQPISVKPIVVAPSGTPSTTEQ